MAQDKKYLNIPVPMLKELHVNSKSFFNSVFDVGVYQYSKTLKGTEEEQYMDALHFFGITQGNIKTAISNAKRVLDRMPSKYPTTGIEKDMLFDFYKTEKSDFDIICLGAFLGLKSLIGAKPYTKTNKAMIHSRMFGYASPKEMPDPLSAGRYNKEIPKELTALQNKYKVRWHMDKILMELQIDWFLKMISDHVRGMYVSFDISLDELALKNEESKQLTKIEQFREFKRKAIDSAKAQLTAH